MLEEIQKNIRWVDHRNNPLYHEEQISFAECSGYDNNMYLNAHAALDRALSHIITRDTSGRADLATHKLDKNKLPEFDPNHRLRVVFEFIPYEENPAKAAPAMGGMVFTTDFGDPEEGIADALGTSISPTVEVTLPPRPISYTKGTLATMNKDALAFILKEEVGERTKAELIEAIVAKQG